MDLKTKNFTLRMYALHRDALQKISDRLGIDPSEYVRRVLVPHIYADLKTAEPGLPAMTRGRFSKQTRQVDMFADQLGITGKQYKALVTEITTDALINGEAIDEKKLKREINRRAAEMKDGGSGSGPKDKSGERSSAKLRAARQVGAYSEQPRGGGRRER